MVHKTAARAPLSHKLAKYLKAIPIHLSGVRGESQPSTSHLSSLIFT